MGDEGCCGATAFLFFGAAYTTNGRSVFIGLEPFCHQEARVILVTYAAIKLRSRIVALIDFEMDGVHSQFANALFDKLHGAPANSLPPILRLDVQLIDERIASVIFEAIAERQNNVAYGSFSIQENPGTA